MSREYVTADLVDAYAESGRIRSCETAFRQFGGRKRFYGAIRTLKVYEDNALIRTLLSEPGAGKVLVVDGGGSLRVALIGDAIAGLALANGWIGIVVFGAVRDVEALAELAIGIKALGSNPWKSTKSGAGFIDTDLHFGNITFRSGAYLYSDEDGILIADSELADESVSER